MEYLDLGISRERSSSEWGNSVGNVFRGGLLTSLLKVGRRWECGCLDGCHYVQELVSSFAQLFGQFGLHACDRALAPTFMASEKDALNIPARLRSTRCGKRVSGEKEGAQTWQDATLSKLCLVSVRLMMLDPRFVIRDSRFTIHDSPSHSFCIVTR